MKSHHILPEPVLQFMNVFKKNGFEIYIVGGAVREMLLKRPINNWDFTTNATPDQIQKLFPNTFYNNTYGTVSVVYGEKKTAPEKTGIFEVTPFRKESAYTDSRHPDSIEWAKTIQEDLKRRDFTINALAFDGTDIIDLFDGQKHLRDKIIVAVGDPDVRFSEDALRLMRAVRIATELGFMIEEKTRASMTQNAQAISRVSGERIRDELFKILESKRPSEGILLLKEVGLLKHILPEVYKCFSVEQKSPGRHHIYDVGTHLVMALKLCPNRDGITRLATLLHDIGKADTFKKDEKTGLITFYNHEIVGAEKASVIADRLHLSKKQKEKLITLVRYHMFTVSEKQTDKAIRRFIRQVGKEYLFDMLDLRVADRLGSGARLTSWRTELFKKRLEEVQQEPFKVTDLAIDGTDVMKTLDIKPGPKVGEILDEIFEDVEEKKLPNVRETLLQKLQELAAPQPE